MKSFQYSYSSRIQPFFSFLEAGGTPIYRYLNKHNIPAELIERPDIRFSSPLVYGCLADCEHSQGVSDLAFQGACKENFGTIEAFYRRQFTAAGTLRNCLDQFFVAVQKYNGRVCALKKYTGIAKISISSEPGFPDEPWQRYSDWSNVMVLVGIFRHVHGKQWAPHKISFQHKGIISEQAEAAFPATSICFAQSETAIIISGTTLAASMPRDGGSRGAPKQDAIVRKTPDTFPDILAEILRPYLADSSMNIHLAAEAAGTSVRTLQRALREFGLSYSALMERERNLKARSLLANTNAKIIEVAYELGYQNPAHFSRAFRRTTGLSPREFRASNEYV